MTDVDVIVIGTGPSGSYTVSLLAQQGLRVLVCEKRPEAGVGGRGQSENQGGPEEFRAQDRVATTSGTGTGHGTVSAADFDWHTPLISRLVRLSGVRQILRTLRGSPPGSHPHPGHYGLLGKTAMARE